MLRSAAAAPVPRANPQPPFAGERIGEARHPGPSVWRALVYSGAAGAPAAGPPAPQAAASPWARYRHAPLQAQATASAAASAVAAPVTAASAAAFAVAVPSPLRAAAPPNGLKRAASASAEPPAERRAMRAWGAAIASNSSLICRLQYGARVRNTDRAAGRAAGDAGGDAARGAGRARD
jgi:hypothetical protein